MLATMLKALSSFVPTLMRRLKAISAKTFALQPGGQVTKGLGAGANPEIGRQAAMEDRERIIEVLQRR